MKGRIHIYCGDGKGKTTAAIGLSVRAAGRGMKVVIARFLKTEDSGEVGVLRAIPGIQVLPCSRTFGFTFQMTPEEKKEAAAYFQDQFRLACREAVSQEADLLILDEILAACNTGMVPEDEVTAFLTARPEKLEVVLTGRDPSDRLTELADYVSEIQARKHPFAQGQKARRGIEF